MNKRQSNRKLQRVRAKNAAKMKSGSPLTAEHTESQPQLESHKQKWKPFLTVRKGLELFAVIVGLVLAGYPFRPQISIEPTIRLEPNNPMSIQFKVTNIGLLSLRRLEYSCRINLARIKGLNISNSIDFTNRIPGQEPTAMLGSGGSATKNCVAGQAGFLIVGGGDPIDLTFTVRFSILGITPKISQSTIFIAVKDESGEIQWVPQSK